MADIKTTLIKLIKQHPKIIKLLKYTAIVYCILFFRKLFIKRYRRARGWPDGPVGLPFFGCFLSVCSNPFYFFTQIAKEYGDVVLVPVFWNNTVYINDANLVRQIFQHSKLNNHFVSHNGLRDENAFDLVNGDEWKRRRKLVKTSLMTLTNTSFVLKSVKQSLNNHVIPLFEENKDNKNFLWYPQQSIAFNSLSIIFAAIFGVTLDFNDKFVQEYITAINTRFRSVDFVILMDICLNRKIPEWLMWNVLSSHRKNEKKMDDILIHWMNNNGFIVDIDTKTNQVFKRKTNDNDINKHATDALYIDTCIQALNDNVISIDKMLSDIQALIGDTIDTTSQTLEYGILLLAKHQNIQQQIFEEIFDVMKRSQIAEFNFKILNELHIIRAFLHECLRISSVVPTGVAHTIYQDIPVQLKNNKTVVLPKGSIVHQNLFYINRKKSWNVNQLEKGYNIDEFDNTDIHLEYWLDSKSKEFKMNDNFIGFGEGKRNCPGQGLAIKGMLAFLGLLITKFKFIPINNNPNSINIKQKWAFVMTIDPQIAIQIEKRYKCT